MKNKIVGVVSGLIIILALVFIVRTLTVNNAPQVGGSNLPAQVSGALDVSTPPDDGTVPEKTVLPAIDNTKIITPPVSTTPPKTDLPTVPPKTDKPSLPNQLPNNSGWQNVGTPGFSANFAAYSESLAFDTNNTPYISSLNGFGGGPNNMEATVMKWNGNSWISIGDPNGISLANNISNLVIGSDNISYVAYGDTTVGGAYFEENQRATVVKWNGNSWVPLGIPRFSQGPIGYSPSLALNSNNIPYLAYNETVNGETKTTVMKFNGTAWVTVGTPNLSGIGFLSLALDSSSTPYLAYMDSVNNGKATVVKFNGNTWVSVGTPGFSAGEILYPSLALDSSNTPYVAYVDSANGYKATVMKFNGNAWVPVGTPGFSAGDIEHYGAGDQTISLKFDAKVDHARDSAKYSDQK